MHNEFEAEREIKELSLNAKMHLSHVVRGFMMRVLSAYCLERDVEAEIKEFEALWTNLGL